MNRNFDDLERNGAAAVRPQAGLSCSAGRRETLEGTVEWFNPRKGYGFVKFSDAPDAYLGANVLAAAGLQTIMPGTTVRATVQVGQRRNVVSLDHVDASTATAAPERPGRAAEDTVIAVLKWYDPSKGYGFLTGADSDIFIHVKILERAGMTELVEGVPYKVGVALGDRGKVAVSIETE